MSWTIKMTLGGVLLAGGWRTEGELAPMSDPEKREALIAKLAAHSNQPARYYEGINNDPLVEKGAIVVLLQEAGIRAEALREMTDQDHRDALLNENSCHTGRPVSQLEGMSNQELVELGLGWLITSMRGVSACCGSDEGATRKRWEDQRHRKIIEMAVTFLQTTAPEADVAAFNERWKDPVFQGAVFQGLHDADYVSPYDSFIYSSHFYDPETKTNYLGSKDKTAKTEALSYYYSALAKRHDDKPQGDIGYDLGLSFHYLTDLSQPMHAANFINIPLVNMLHSHFEKWLDVNLNRFHAVPPDDRGYLDRYLTAAKNVDGLIESLAVKSKAIWRDHLKPHLQPLMDISLQGAFIVNLMNGSFDGALQETLSNGEIAAAAFLLSWSRGAEWSKLTDVAIDAIYYRLLKRSPDPDERITYREFLGAKRHTARDMVVQIGSSHEYYRSSVEGKEYFEVMRVVFRDFLGREFAPDRRPMPAAGDVSEEAWRAMVRQVVDSSEYRQRFGDSGLPAPVPVSDSERRQGTFSLRTGDVIALQPYDDHYLGRINRGDRNPIEAAKGTVDKFSQFTVTVQSDGRIALKADSGKYLSRINRGVELNPIEAAKDSIDDFSQFRPVVLEGRRVALRADTGKFLSQIGRDGKSTIEAAKSSIDRFSHFRITRIPR